jgi:hypothetical protein
MKAWPGRPYTAGSYVDGEGLHVALCVEYSTSVLYLPEGRPGLHDGRRVNGPEKPGKMLLHDPRLHP